MSTVKSPQGPHVALVDTETNRVLSWTPFTPVFQGENDKRFSVSPKDERVRRLANQCRELRGQGKKVELRFIV